jgi:hypothetical protein
LLYTDQGRARASIFTISHLSDPERMFFVSMLLNEILGWMRTQSGTSSLRALLYMDEIFGYFPPIKNPPSKTPLLTLLKQARAFGLGVVLSTQNPVDLDYKGLSNAGTWFIGRLQTEQDKERVLAGLQGAAGGAGFDRGRMEEILAGLGQRVFLLHNVHEDEDAIFQTRWTLSYLRGPMTREQIKILTADRKIGALSTEDLPPKTGPVASTAPAAAIATPNAEPAATEAPVVSPGIESFFLAASGAGQGLVYYPALVGRMDVHYTSNRYKVDVTETTAYAAEMDEGPVVLDWDNATEIDLDLASLGDVPLPGAEFAELPAAAQKVTAYKKWSKDLLRWVRQNRPLVLYRSNMFKLTSYFNENEGEFRARLAQIAREKRDVAAEKLRRKYSSKFTTLKNSLLRAEQAIQREQEQAKSKKMATVISFGTALLGAFMGRKAVSRTSTYRVGTAMKSAGRLRKETMDVARAQEKAEAVKQQMAELEMQLNGDLAGLDASFDPAFEELDEIRVKPKSTNITLELFGLAWMPYRKDAKGRITPDWR